MTDNSSGDNDGILLPVEIDGKDGKLVPPADGIKELNEDNELPGLDKLPVEIDGKDGKLVLPADGIKELNEDNELPGLEIFPPVEPDGKDGRLIFLVDLLFELKPLPILMA